MIREQIIEILKNPHWFLNGKLFESDFERIADAILALPLDLPSDEEIKDWVEEDEQELIDKYLFTKQELLERKQGRYDGIRWMIKEIIKRNK